MTIVRSWVLLALVSIVPLGCGGGGGDDDDDDTTDVTPGGDDDDDTASGSVTAVDCGSVTADQTVTAQGFAFDPTSTTISAGQVVQWTNQDSADHTVTSGAPDDSDAGSEFDEALPKSGGTVCLQFNAAGSFSYFCRPHPNMVGTVTVE